MTASTLGAIVAEHGGVIQTGPFGTQLHQRDYTDQGVPVVMPKDIRNGRVDESSIARVSERKARDLARYLLKPGSVVFPRRGEIGKCAYIRQRQAGFLCGTGCIKLEPPESRLRSRFLFYYLGLRRSIEWLERNAVGTTMGNLNTAILGGLAIPLLSPDQQDSIVGILSSYDDLIENNRRRILLLEEAARQIYKEWFVRLRFPGHRHVPAIDGLPEGWRKKPLFVLCRDVRDSTHPEDLPPDTAYIGLEHIPRRSITLENWGCADEVHSGKFRFAEGDILFGRIRPYLHKVGLAPVGGITSSDTVVVRAAKPRFRWHALLLLSSDEFVALAAKTVREGTKMPRADWKFLLKARFRVPPRTLLRTFDEAVAPKLTQLHNLARQNRALARARDLLLPRLISGEITV